MAAESFPMYCNRLWREEFGDKASTPLTLQSLEVRTVINTELPDLSITTTTMTFINNHDKTLEGALEFELPEEAVVSGFGLDLEGAIVDGVVIDKEKARVAFEEAVREGKSAAIAEAVAGNIFKNRVYPIHAGGTRQVRVSYQDKPRSNASGDLLYTVPIRFDSKLTNLSIQVECVAPQSKGLDPPRIEESKAPKPSSGSLTLARVKKGEVEEDRFLATATWEAIEPQADPEAFSYTVVLPHAATLPLLAMELDTDDGKTAYFALSCMPKVHSERVGEEEKAEATPVQHVAVYWDASLSRDPTASATAAEDRKTETQLLKVLLEQNASLLKKGSEVRVSVIPFSAEPLGVTTLTFKSDAIDAKWGDLLKCLDAVEYDGGTNLSHLKFTRSIPEEKTPVDVYLVFSDGFVTLGTETPPTAQSPVFTVNAASKSNSALLRVFAETSGGMYFNRAALADPATAVKSILEPSFQFISAEVEGAVVEMYPSHSKPLSESKDARFTLAGRVKSDSKLTLRFGKNRKPTYVQTFELRLGRAAASSGLVARQWAQSKINELNAFQEMNKDKINELGKKFSIITGGSSFVVLEHLEQYIKHKVVPPKTREALHRLYMNHTESEQSSENSRRANKLRTLQSLLATRKSWHQRTFETPSPIRRGGEKGAAARSRSPERPGFLSRLFARSSRSPPPQERAAPMHEEEERSMDIQRDGLIAVERERGEQADRKESRAVVGALGVGAMVKAKKASSSAGPSAPSAPSARASARASAPIAKESARRSSDAPELAMSRDEAGGESDDDEGGGGGDDADGMAVGGALGGLRADSAGAVSGEGDAGEGAKIQVQAWDPSTPYLREIKAAKDLAAAYKAYLTARSGYRASPAFYFDCASYFFDYGEKKSSNASPGRSFGLRILTSVLELELDSPQLLRIVGYKLAELALGPMAVSVFEKVLALRPDEPQSPRDLALVLYENQMDFERALILYDKVLMGEWPARFNEIELTALIELNAMIHSPWGKPLHASFNASRAQMGQPPLPDASLVADMPVDLRIVMGWDTDMTDVDLHVHEPSGAHCYYSNKSTGAGGQLSRDFTQGYGPEEYSIKKAPQGVYTINAKYFASHQQSLTGATTLLLYIYRFFGTSRQEKQVITLRLSGNKDIIKVAEVTFKS